jgi:hypothetical protein
MFRDAVHSSAECTASRRTFYCQVCGKLTQHLNITEAALHVEVAQSTMYRWIRRGFIHWTDLPCGHRAICRESLSRPA